MKLKSSTSAALLAFIVCVLFLIADSFDFYLSSSSEIYVTVIVLQIVVFVLPAALYCRIRSTEISGKLRLRPFSSSGLLLTLLAAATMIVCGLLINFLRVKLGGSVAQYALYRNLLIPSNSSITDTAAATLAFALIPALSEEFLFRSILLAEFEEKGPFTAIFMSTLLFGIVHFSPDKLPEYLISGIILCLLTYVTDSVFAPALAHFIYNFFCTFGLSYINKIIEHLQSLSLLIFVCVSLLLILLAASFGTAQQIYGELNKQNKKPEYLKAVNLSDKPSIRFFSALTSFPMLACLLLFFAAVYKNL